MKSDGSQIRSYCYCLDCASAMLKVLLCGENCHAYNISNPDSIISIKQMAEILVKSAGVELRMELPTDEERKGYDREMERKAMQAFSEAAARAKSAKNPARPTTPRARP